MSWREIHKILKKTSDEALRSMLDHPEAVPVPNPKITAELGGLAATVAEHLVLHNRLAPAVDEACRFFAEHQRWPLVTPEVAQAALTRVIAGVQFSRFVARPSLPTLTELPDFQQAGALPEMLRWVLIDYWHRGGIWRWYASMNAVLSGKEYDDEVD